MARCSDVCRPPRPTAAPATRRRPASSCSSRLSPYTGREQLVHRHVVVGQLDRVPLARRTAAAGRGRRSSGAAAAARVLGDHHEGRALALHRLPGNRHQPQVRERLRERLHERAQEVVVPAVDHVDQVDAALREMVGDHLVELLRGQVVRDGDVVERVAEHEVVALVVGPLSQRQPRVLVLDLDLGRVAQARGASAPTSVTSGSISATTDPPGSSPPGSAGTSRSRRRSGTS